MRSRNSPVDDAAIAVARCTQRLDPGPLAELRRLSPNGAPAFWLLAAQHPATIGGDRQSDWMEIVRMIAVLTPKGDPKSRPPLHDRNRRLGAVLCDGGDADLEWKGPQPNFSERRLTQLVAARGKQRAALLERAVRALARTRPPDAGIDVTDLARAVLRQDDAALLAAPYYRRLDCAERIAKQTQDQTQGAIDA